METTAITASQAVIDLDEIVARLEDLTALPVRTKEQEEEHLELLSVAAQTVHMDACEYFTPMLYRLDAMDNKLANVAYAIEVRFYGVAYLAVATVAG